MIRRWTSSQWIDPRFATQMFNPLSNLGGYDHCYKETNSNQI